MTKTEYCVFAEDVMALVDGELSAADARAVSAHVEQCSECALVMEQLRGVSESLSRWSVPEVPMAVEEFVGERLERTSARRTMRVKFPLRRLLVAGGGAVVFAALFLVFVFQTQQSSRSYSRVRTPQAVAEQEAPGLTALEDRSMPSRQLRSKARAGVAGMSATANGALDAPLLSEAPAPMIARTMSVTIMVKDVEAARTSLDSVLARHHGYSANLNVSSPESGSRNVRASLRIPEPELASAAAEIKALGRTVNEMQSGEEVSQQHADLVARLKTARETEARFQAILQQRTGKLSDVLEVEQNIARVRGEIEAMEAEQKALEHRVDFATLDVQFVEEYKAKLESPAENSVSTRMHNSFVAGYHNATETLLGVVLFAEEYGPPILIWLAILGLPAVAIWRRYKRIRSGR